MPCATRSVGPCLTIRKLPTNCQGSKTKMEVRNVFIAFISVYDRFADRQSRRRVFVRNSIEYSHTSPVSVPVLLENWSDLIPNFWSMLR